MVVSFSNQKGGVAKTTSCVNSIISLKKLKPESKCCLIDFDAQANASMSFGFTIPEEIENTVNECLLGLSDIRTCIYETKYGVDIIPSKSYLSGAIITILNNAIIFPSPVTLLQDIVETIKNEYDYIFIDLPPELGLFTLMGLMASDAVVIPLQPEARASRGINMLMDNIYNIESKYQKKIKILGILPTMVQATNAHTTILQQTRKYFDGYIKVFETTIPRAIKYAEADYFNIPAVEYSDTLNIETKSYEAFVKECFLNG